MNRTIMDVPNARPLTIHSARPEDLSESSNVVASNGWAPELRALISGLLLWAAFPPNGHWWLASIALISWFGNSVAAPPLSRRRTFLSALVGGIAFWLPALQWVRLSDPSAWAGWLVMSLALAIWWPVMAMLVRRLHVRNGWPVTIVWPVVWGFQEIGREYYMTGFPWYHLAHSQFRQTWLIQIADLGGASLLSVLLVGFQAWVAQWFFTGRWTWAEAPACWRRTGAALGVIAILVIAYGQARLHSGKFEEGPKVALLQSDIPQSRRLYPDHDELIEAYRKLIEKSLTSNEALDLIVWPETSFPYPLIVIEAALDEATVKHILGDHVGPAAADDWYRNRSESQAFVNAWASQSGVPMIVGATAWDISGFGLRKYNTAALFHADAEPQYYYKMHLVPFGEYIPWTETVPVIAELAPFPPDQRPNLKHGDSARVLTLKNRWRMAPLICFEDTVPHVVRRFFRDSWLNAGKDAGATSEPGHVDILLNLSNDGWFRGSEEHEVHLASSVFRCVENRRSMLRAVNTGISCIIDSNGSILEEAAPSSERIIISQVPVDKRVSVYSLIGDLTGLTCAAGVAAGCFLRNRKNVQFPQASK
ncbi:apolipoprotein N-acyltransferase [bacterium]|nr:apolipoprotein N-acyltransferase [bacterium]